MAKGAEVGEENWVPARLIPAGKMRPEEQETKATSVLLAVLPVVPNFGRALLRDLKAPKGRISTFTEVRLKDGNGKTHIPDGAIVVERGKTKWACLVEVKTGRTSLDSSQVARYLEMAREHGFDAANDLQPDTQWVRNASIRRRSTQGWQARCPPHLLVADPHRGDRPAPLPRRQRSRAGLDSRRAGPLP